MLLLSLITDLAYFYINLFRVTRDYSDNPLNKYRYFTKENLKVFEEIVDEIILEIKGRVKKVANEKKDKSLHVNLYGGYQMTLSEFN